MKLNKSILFIAVVLGLYSLAIFYKYQKSHFIDIKKAYHKQNLIPVAIIGSGPGGLTAALYTARAHMPTIVFTGPDIGGQLTEARFVENWPAKKKETGINLMTELEEQVKHFGAHLVNNSVKSVDFSQWPYVLKLDNDETVHALALIIATGGHQKKLNIPGVEQYWGKGIGICSICDAPFDKGKEVAVLGKTDITCDMALQLKEFAKKVYVLVPDQRMQAAACSQQYLKEAENISLLFNVQVKKIIGDNQRVTGVEIEDKVTGKKQTLPIQSFYFAIGFKPASELFEGQLSFQEKGYIAVNQRLQTSKDLIYAVGTVIDPIYQKGLISAAMGAQAAIQLIEDLQNSGFTDKAEEELRQLFYKKDEIQVPIQKLSTLEEINTELQDGLVLIEFYGQNCVACKVIEPVFKEVAPLLNDRIKFVKFDIQKDNAVLDHYQIKQIPTFIVYKNGKEQGRTINVADKNALIKFIEQYLSQ